MGIRCNLSSSGNMRGDMYRSGGGGSVVTIDPVYNSGTKIADYSIDGEDGEIYIPSQYTITNLWNYVTDNTSQIVYDGTLITLSDSILNYDELVVEVVSDSGDLGNEWRSSAELRINVHTLINGIEPYNYVFCTYDTRSSKIVFTNNTVQKTSGFGSINGIINVYGIKY